MKLRFLFLSAILVRTPGTLYDSNTFFADFDCNDFLASLYASFSESVFPARYMAAAELISTRSVLGDVSLPDRMSSAIFIFSSSDTEDNCFGLTGLLIPKSLGLISYCFIFPAFSSKIVVGPLRVISSKPSDPTATMTLSLPKALHTSIIIFAYSIFGVPISCLLALTGLRSGPSILKKVGLFNSDLTGAKCFIAGWKLRAYKKARWYFRYLSCSSLLPKYTGMPRLSSKSKLPNRPLAALLPCLATLTPAPATTKALIVLVFIRGRPDPPVPQRSIAPESLGASSMSVYKYSTASAISPALLLSDLPKGCWDKYFFC